MNENTPQDSKADSDLELTEVPAEEFAAVADEALAEEAQPESEIEQLRAALAESEKRAIVAVADLENFRKRTSKQTQEQIRYAALPLMNDLLESVDNLNRAVESESENESNASLLQGVKMVSDQILNLLKANHCKPIEAVGVAYDPNIHQAVKMQPSDEFPAHTVMMEMRTGYMLHERVIRPSQVFVSTGPEETETKTE